uniref:ATP synthase F0 subunit 8 n=1 Tax=Sycophila sp. 2 JXW-2020 TaxID=2781670 RepID=A0A8A3UXQ0_9HYME|nr:ATP synthase F0 subunit 8 [Sycophila sp. 2 JXW-2020]
MPQMSPLFWLFLYIYLILVIYVFNCILNFFYLKFPKNLDLKKAKKMELKWFW